MLRRTKHAVIAAAVIATWSAVPVFGQTTASGSIGGPIVDARANPEERASAVIRVIDAPAPMSEAVLVTTADLVRARAAGEMQVPERGEPIQIERIQIDDPARSATRGSARAQAQGKGDVQPQIVRAGAEPRDRTRTQPIVRLDDAARYRETAKYEAEKKVRQSTRAAAATEPAQPRNAESPVTVMGSAQGRAEITWSPPERPQPPVVVVESPQEILRN